MSSDDSQHAAPPVRLGAYAARSCAVRAQWDVVRPCEPEPDTPFRAGLARDGIAFEADVVAELAAREPDAEDRTRWPAKEGSSSRTRSYDTSMCMLVEAVG